MGRGQLRYGLARTDWVEDPAMERARADTGASLIPSAVLAGGERIAADDPRPISEIPDDELLDFPGGPGWASRFRAPAG